MPNVQRIMAHLQSEWRTGLRLTTVAQAMAALGLPENDELRWQVGRALEAEWQKQRSVPGLLRGIKWLAGQNRVRVLRFLPGILFGFPRLLREARDWNPAVYILREDEKLVARQILLAQKQSRSVPPASTIAESLSLSPEAVARGLAMLTRLGVLMSHKDGYALAPDHERFSRGLGFNFHTVTLSTGEVFNVP
jgi:hypothetical protein